MKRESRAPLILAIVLLLLPVLYVGSYFALVKTNRSVLFKEISPGVFTPLPMRHRYRFGGIWSEKVFWPAEQLDRRLRPKEWNL